MKVINIQQRIIRQPKQKLGELFKTLSSEDDKIWPLENWPAMRFNKGLQIGSKGGHGPIRYSIIQYIPGERIEFQFSRPKGFIGLHRFELNSIDETSTQVKHCIDMQASIGAYIIWIIAIRWLHEALLTDALDKIENQFSEKKHIPNWNSWVKCLRYLYKPR